MSGAATLDFLAAAVTPEFRADPYPWYHQLRATEPVHHTSFGVWLLTRHADVAAVVRDPGLSNDERHRTVGAEAEARGDVDNALLLFLDPPDHTRIRGLVS